MNLKIGYDAKRAFFNSSGLGNYSRGVIDIMTKFYPENDYFLYAPIKTSNNLYHTPEKVILKNPESFVDKLLPSYWRSYGIIKQLRSDKIDIFHGLSNELPLNIHKFKAKKIVTIHDLIFLRYPELYKFWDRKIYEKKLRYCCNVADAIISISEQTKNDIIDFTGTEKNKIITVYQSCHDRFKEKMKVSDKNKIQSKYNLPEEYILFVGTIEKRKNLLNIVKSLKLFTSDIPLIVIGRPTVYLNGVKEYIAKNNLNDRVLFFHNIRNEELPGFYQMAKIFIYPSVFEGFGIPIIEALYSGVPVITSTGSCFSEAGGPDSFYVSPDNPEQIAFAIEKLLSNETLRQEIINKGLQYVQKFDDRKVAEKLAYVYNSLM